MGPSTTAAALAAFCSKHPTVGFGDPGGRGLDGLEWEGLDRPRVEEALRRCWPLRHVAPDVQVALHLVEGGFTSVGAVSRAAPRTLERALDGVLAPEQVRALHARAHGAHARLTQSWLRSREALSPMQGAWLRRQAPTSPLQRRTRATAAAPSGVAAPEASRTSAPGTEVNYQTLFGEAPVRQTPTSMSVFGPGAYFYDLMDLVQTQITTPNTAPLSSSPIPTALTLRGRRPDLWNLPLTPPAIETHVSQVDLTREILESTLRQLTPAIPVLGEAPLPEGVDNTYLCSDLADLKAALAAAADGSLIVVTWAGALAPEAPLVVSTSVKIVAGAAGVAFDCSARSAFHIGASRVILKDLSFTSVEASPAIRVDSGALSLVNCLFVSGCERGSGWVVNCTTSAEVSLQNVTAYDAVVWGETTPAMFSASDPAGSVTFNLVNTLLWINGGLPTGIRASHFDFAASAAVANLMWSDVAGGDPGLANVFYDRSNFTADPLFPLSDGTLTGTQPYLKLPGVSPCIGRGARGGNVGASWYDIYAAISRAIHPFDTPFDVEIASAAMVLQAAQLTLPEIDEALQPFDAPGAFNGASALGLGLPECQLLTTEITSADTLAPYYGLSSFDSVNVVLASQAGAPLDPAAGGYTLRASAVMTATGLTATGLRELVYQDLSPAEIAAGVQRGRVAWASSASKPWRGFFVNAGLGSGLALQALFAPVGRQYADLSGIQYARFSKPMGTSPLSAALWVYPQTAGGVLFSFVQRVWTMVNGQQQFLYAQTEIRFELDTSGALTVSWKAKDKALVVLLQIADALPIGAWTALAATFDPQAGTLQIFRAGRPLTKVQLTTNEVKAFKNTSDLVLHPLYTDGSYSEPSGTNLSRSLFSDVATWSSTLDPETVAAQSLTPPLTTPTPSASTGSLHSYWPLCDSSSTYTNWVTGRSNGKGYNSPGRGAAWLPENQGKVPTDGTFLLTSEGLSFVQQEMLVSQGDEGRVGVSVAQLDRINRFVRLARRLQWSFADLDWALFLLGLPLGEGISPSPISLPALDSIATLLQLQRETGLSVSEVCSLFGYLVPYGKGEDGQRLPLFDLAFNRPPLAGIHFTPLTSRVVVVDATGGPDLAIIRRVAASVALSTAELGRLVTALGKVSGGTITLDWQSLSGLYRCRALAGLFGLDVDGLIELLDFAGSNPMDASFDEDALLYLVRARRVSHLAEVEPAELALMMTPPQKISPTGDPYQLFLEQRFTNGLPQLQEQLRRGLSTSRLSPATFSQDGVDAPSADAFFDRCVTAGYLTRDGLVAPPLLATLPEVAVQVPALYATLREGVQAAVDLLRSGASSAVVLVAPGTYVGDNNTRITIDLADLRGTLLITSEAGPDATFLECMDSSAGPVLQVSTPGQVPAEAAIVLDGFTIRDSTNPNTTEPGVGTLEFQRVPRVTVRSCVFSDNSAQTGDAIHIVGVSGSPTVARVVGCVVFYDVGAPRSVAIDVLDCDLSVFDSTFYAQTFGSGQMITLGGGSTGTVTRCILPVDAALPLDDTNYTYDSSSTFTLVDPDHGEYAPLFPEGEGRAGVGYAVDMALGPEQLYAGAFAQLEILRQVLVPFFGCGDLPLVPILRYVGAHFSALDLLQEPTAQAAQVDYLRSVFLYLTLASEFELGGSELTQLLAEPALFGFTPPEAGALWVPSRKDLRTLARHLLLKRRAPGREEDLLKYLRDALGESGGVVVSQASKLSASALADLYGWDLATTQSLLSALQARDAARGHTTAALPAILDLSRVFSLAQDRGLGVGLLRTLQRNGLILGGDGATPLLQGLSAAAPEAAAELRLSISEMKRNILKIFAIPAIDGLTRSAGMPIEDQDDLSNYLLADVAMGPQTDTSRVLQATLSVQQYVQRVRMGLEPGISTLALTDERWAWMESYSTWQANRRVYLYPENYLRPELRKGRTPLFREVLEQAEGEEVSPAQAEKLCKAYVEGLATLGALRTVGAWYELSADTTPSAAQGASIGRYHLIGRTQGQPWVYYYRTFNRYVDGQGQVTATDWTPWERIDLAIPSDCATPAMLGGQLYLFWAERTFRPDTSEDIQGGNFEVSLRFAVRKSGGGWGPVQAPFPTLTIPAGASIDATAAWQRPWVTPTTSAGADALLVQYGDYSGESAPWIFVLNADGSVVGGLNYASTEITYNTTQTCVGVAAGQRSGGIGKVTGLPPWAAGGVALRPFGRHAVVPGYSSSLAVSLGLFQPDASTIAYSTSALTWVNGSATPALSLVGNSTGMTWHGGRYYLLMPNATDVDVYCSGLAGDTASWTRLTTTMLSGTKPVYCPSVVSAWGWLVAAYLVQVGSAYNLQVSRSRDGTHWENVWTLYGVGKLNPTLSLVGGTLFGVYSDHDAHLLYAFSFKDAGAAAPSTSTTSLAWNNDNQIYETSNLLKWKGAWYMAMARNEDSKRVALMSAPTLKGTWRKLGLITSYEAYSPSSSLGLALLPSATALVLGAGLTTSDNSTHQGTFHLARSGLAPTFSLPWSDAWNGASPSVKASPTSALVRAPWPGTGTTSLLSSPGDEPSALPVGNQLGAFLLSTRGGDFLAESYSSAGAFEDRRVLATLSTTQPTVSFSVAPRSGTGSATPPTVATLRLRRLSSTAATSLLQLMNQRGTDGVMAPAAQRTVEVPFYTLGPNTSVITQLDDVAVSATAATAADVISYRLEDAYGAYFRELYYFLPWLLSDRLREAHRYEQGRRWLLWVFNPNDPTASTAWPSAWMQSISPGSDTDALVQPNAAAMALYHQDPYDAEALASLRPPSYQRALFVAYTRHLLAWADSRFAVNTRESLSEAAQLYRLAGDLLGKEPELLPYIAPVPQTWAELSAQQQSLGGNEFLLPVDDAPPVPLLQPSVSDTLIVQGAYFGVPDNPSLAHLWDVVDDRLYRLRHGLDLSGAPTRLPLYEPGADAQGLVRAAAGGGQGTVALTPGASPPRGDALMAISSARELAQAVRDFGNSVLSALQSRDSETLASLQAAQEVVLAEQLSAIRLEEVQEARASLTGLMSARAAAQERERRFKMLAARGLSALETAALSLQTASLAGRSTTAAIHLTSVVPYLLPTIFGLAGGGMELGDAVTAGAQATESLATMLSEKGAILATQAEYQRREEEWRFEAGVAAHDVRQLEADVEAATRRVEVAQLQHRMEQTTLRQRREVHRYYESRFTNQELYQWMVDTLGGLYYQLYQVADSAARIAQSLVNEEMGQTTSYITAGAWDAQRRGLLAGERLYVDLARMEQEYLKWERANPPQEVEVCHCLETLAPELLRSLAEGGGAEFDLDFARLQRAQPGLYRAAIQELRLEFVGWEGEELQGEFTQLRGRQLRRPDLEGASALLELGGAPGSSVGRDLRGARARFSTTTGVTGALTALKAAPVVGRYRLILHPGERRPDPAALKGVHIRVKLRARDGGEAFRVGILERLPPARHQLLLEPCRIAPARWERLLAAGEPFELGVERAQLPREVAGVRWRVRRLRLHVLTAATAEGEELAVAIPPWVGERRITLPGQSAEIVITQNAQAPVAALCAQPARLTLTGSPAARAAVRELYLVIESEEG